MQSHGEMLVSQDLGHFNPGQLFAQCGMRLFIFTAKELLFADLPGAPQGKGRV